VPLALGGAGMGFLHGRFAAVRSGGHDEEDGGS
jgi:hypothetical protein